jgi:hypothetical protein
LFAAVALDRAIDSYRRVAVAGLAIAMVALTLALLPSRLSANLDVTRGYRAAHGLIARVQPPAVVFLSERRDEGFKSTTPFLQNRPDLTGPVLYGSDLDGRDIALLHTMPSRAPYRFVYEAGSDGDVFKLHPSLTELEVRKGREVTTRLRLRNPGVGSCAVAYARIGDQTTSVVLDTRSGKGRSYDVVWTLRAPGAPSRGGSSPFVLTLPETGPSGGQVRLGARFGADCRIRTVDRYERRYPFVVDRGSGSSVEMLAPGAGWHQVWFPGHPPAWLRQNLDGIVTERR